MTYSKPSGVDPDRPHFDRAGSCAWNPDGNRQRRVEILRFDQIVAAELLAAFGKRPGGRQRLAVTHPRRRRGRDRTKPVAGLEIAGLDDRLRERDILLGVLLQDRRVELRVFGLVLVDHQQVLHGWTPGGRHRAPGLRHDPLSGITVSRTGRSRNDIATINYFGFVLVFCPATSGRILTVNVGLYL